ncbi:ATP13A3 [Cordylochernes scorpioides]|uniref:ATP13A3 n=1 Tax=Cordylochernes scorpioides TaxID=51811 RepID=A0ABY6LTH5_9ARAC|nr:ATP13A3 [Cordylochernes scorpioides]
MASCHSLALVHGKAIGYPLDLKVFQAIGWVLMEPEKDERTVFERTPARIVRPPWTKEDQTVPYVAILKEFPFESALRRMTVVTRLVGEPYFHVFTKGAPEMIESLCRPETVPLDFEEVLEGHARQGFRILAIASRRLDTDWEEALNMSRESLEKDMNLEGLLVLQNPLKPETAPALNILKEANIRSIMVTGDNMLTALTVAGDCGMIEERDSVISVEASPSGDAVSYRYTKLPGYSEKLNMASNNGPIEDIYIPLLYQGRYHLAIEGTTFDIIRQNNQELLHKVVQRGTIFARMAPDQKLRLIEVLQRVGYQVGMCGDGANDCGALKTAHAGVSLSMAEASVASPFTSKVQNITCVPTLIREGRATLVSTFGAFRYMVCYCFVLLSAVLLMFWDGQKPTDGAYVMIDIVLCLLPPFFFGWTEAYPRLHPKKPIRSILSFLPQFSMFSFIVIQIGVYFLAYYYCLIQPW